MEEGKDKKGSFGDQIKDKINYQKRISIAFPEKVFLKLDKLSKERANDCYWLAIDMAIDKFLDSETKDLTTILLMERDDKLKKAIEELAIRLDKLEQPEENKKIKKHFGGKEVKENE